MSETALVTDFLVGKDEITQRMTQLMKRSEELGNLTARGMIGSKKAAEDIKNLKEQFGDMGGAIDDSFNRGEAAAGRFDMRMLSVMFTGMALQRMFGGMLRSIKETFFKAENDTSDLTESTSRLTAAVEFFKFSLFDALNTPFFINVIDGITSVIDWFGQMSNTTKQIILGVVGGLATVGTGLFLLGQVKLGWDAMFAMGGFFASSDKLKSGMSSLRTMAKAGIAIKAAFDIANYMDGDLNLRQLIDQLGMDLALLGLVSGQPWMIAVGIVPKLLPLGAGIAESGKSLATKGMENIMSAITDEEGSKFANSMQSIGGSAQIAAGLVVEGFGTILDYGDKLIDRQELINEQQKMFEEALAGVPDKIINEATAINETLIPAMDDLTFKTDEFSGNTTTTFVDSTDKRIEKINEETEAINERNRALLGEIVELGGGSVTNRNKSSVKESD